METGGAPPEGGTPLAAFQQTPNAMSRLEDRQRLAEDLRQAEERVEELSATIERLTAENAELQQDAEEQFEAHAEAKAAMETELGCAKSEARSLRAQLQALQAGGGAQATPQPAAAGQAAPNGQLAQALQERDLLIAHLRAEMERQQQQQQQRASREATQGMQVSAVSEEALSKAAAAQHAAQQLLGQLRQANAQVQQLNEELGQAVAAEHLARGQAAELRRLLETKTADLAAALCALGARQQELGDVRRMMGAAQQEIGGLQRKVARLELRAVYTTASPRIPAAAMTAAGPGMSAADNIASVQQWVRQSQAALASTSASVQQQDRQPQAALAAAVAALTSSAGGSKAQEQAQRAQRSQEQEVQRADARGDTVPVDDPQAAGAPASDGATSRGAAGADASGNAAGGSGNTTWHAADAAAGDADSRLEDPVAARASAAASGSRAKGGKAKGKAPAVDAVCGSAASSAAGTMRPAASIASGSQRIRQLRSAAFQQVKAAPSGRHTRAGAAAAGRSESRRGAAMPPAARSASHCSGQAQHGSQTAAAGQFEKLLSSLSTAELRRELQLLLPPGGDLGDGLPEGMKSVAATENALRMACFAAACKLSDGEDALPWEPKSACVHYVLPSRFVPEPLRVSHQHSAPVCYVHRPVGRHPQLYVCTDGLGPLFELLALGLGASVQAAYTAELVTWRNQVAAAAGSDAAMTQISAALMEEAAAGGGGASFFAKPHTQIADALSQLQMAVAVGPPGKLPPPEAFQAMAF